MSTDSLDIEPQYREWATHRGYRPSRAAICPLVVASRHHRYNGACICDRYRFNVLDHARMWFAPPNTHVLTGEPYSLPGQILADFLSDLAPYDLNVWVSGDGLWHPATMLVLVQTEYHSRFGPIRNAEYVDESRS